MARTLGTHVLIRDFGTCLSFNGTGDNVACGNGASLQLTTATITAWIRTSNAGTSYRGILTKDQAYLLYLKDNIVVFYDISAGTDRSTGVNVADNRWHHIAVSYQSGITNGTFVYIDGVLKLTTTATSVNQSVQLVIGRDGSGNVQQYAGLIDDVRIYNTNLSGANITDLYNGAFTSVANIAGWWKFDEGSGTTANDSSGNSNTGTITGAAYVSTVFSVPRTLASSRTLASGRALA